MILSFHPCIVADAQIIPGDRHLNADDYALIRGAGVIILPQSCSHDLYRVCKRGSALLFPNYDARFQYPGKIGQSLLFKKIGCPHPMSLQWSSVEEFKRHSRYRYHLPHSLPFIIKSDTGHEAEGIHLIQGMASLESTLMSLALLEKSGSAGFITQELIASKGNVLRVVILGKEIITYWKRPETSGRIITTISRGALIDKEWRPDLQEAGKDRVGDFSTEADINLAAIDLIFDLENPDPAPLFLEINYYFGRRGLGGSLNYYKRLFEAVRAWLDEKGFDPERISLV